MFEAFASGHLDDDDEVAIIHAPARISFAAASEAMVNIRRTLERALFDNVLRIDRGGDDRRLAKRSYYADREWPKLLSEARASLRATSVDALKAWLPNGRVDIKREDALELARLLSSSSVATADAPQVYEHTRLVEAVRQAAVRRRASVPELESTGALLALCRKRGISTAAHELLALVDVLLAERSRVDGTDPDEEAILHAANEWRHSAGLHGKDAADTWFAQHGLALDELLGLLERDVRLIQAREALGPLIDVYLFERLRFHQELPDLGAYACDTGAALD
jgi:hypothetical protein